MVLYNIKLLGSLTEMIRDISLELEGQRTQRTQERTPVWKVLESQHVLLIEMRQLIK